MTALKEDLKEIVTQDLDYVRSRLDRFRRWLPDIVRHPLDSADDLIARWSGRSAAGTEKERRGRRSKE